MSAEPSPVDTAATYDDEGRGPVVVALHSSASTRQQWRGLAARLADRCRLLRLDLAGYGARPLPEDEEHRLDDEVAIVDEVLAHAAVDGPVHLVGHSYGGAVASALALTDPSRVASLTVYEPVLFHLLRDEAHPGWDEIRTVPARMRELLAEGDQEGAARHFVDYWTGPGSFAAFPERTQQALVRVARKVVLDFTALFAFEGPIERFAGLDLPVRVVSGTAGPQPARTIAGLVGAATGAGVTHLDGLGHMGPVTHADRVDPVVVDHLAHVGAA